MTLKEAHAMDERLRFGETCHRSLLSLSELCRRRWCMLLSSGTGNPSSSGVRRAERHPGITGVPPVFPGRPPSAMALPNPVPFQRLTPRMAMLRRAMVLSGAPTGD